MSIRSQLIHNNGQGRALWFGRGGLVVALLLVAALGSPGTAFGSPAKPAAAALTPATGVGQITVYSSFRIHFSTRGIGTGMTAGPDGALWFTNSSSNSIGRITTTGKVTGYRSPHIEAPWAITTGPDRALWFTNWAYTASIGRITAKGAVTSFTGAISGPNSIAPGPDGALWYTNSVGWSIGRITTKGVSTSFTAPGVENPQDIVAGSDHAMWFVNGGSNGQGYAIGRISRLGKITLYSLSDYPGDIAAGPDGRLWFTYPNNNAIGRITVRGVVTTFSAKSISKPTSIAAGSDGNLWFLNTGNNTIGRITTNGRVTSYRGAPKLSPGGAVITAGPDGAMWFTSPPTNKIGRITTNVTPWIFSKTPASGPPGTRVTIFGRNLAPLIQVAFHGVRAAIVSSSATRVVAIVPTHASSGRITVTTHAGTATVNGWFTVTAPTSPPVN